MTSRSKPRFLLPAAILVGCCLLVLLHLARGDDNRRDCELGMSAKLLIDAQSVTIQDPNLGDIKVTRDGDLWMDGEQLDIGHRDREQLQTFERQLRKVVPEIMDITQESIEFAIRLLAEAFEAILDQAPPEEVRQTFADLREELRKEYRRDDDTLFINGSRLKEMEQELEAIEPRLEKAVEKAVRETIAQAFLVAGEALNDKDWSLEESLADFSRRMEAYGKLVEKNAAKHAEELEARADLLCRELGKLHDSERRLHRAIPELRELNLFL